MNEASDDEDHLQKTDSEDETDEDIDFESDEEEPRSGSGKYNMIMFIIQINDSSH